MVWRRRLGRCSRGRSRRRGCAVGSVNAGSWCCGDRRSLGRGWPDQWPRRWPHVGADLVAVESLHPLFIDLVFTSVGVIGDDEDPAMLRRRRAVRWEGERSILEAEFCSQGRVRSDLTHCGRVRESHSNLIRVCRSCIAEPEGDPIRVVVVMECILAEPDAPGNGSAD